MLQIISEINKISELKNSILHQKEELRTLVFESKIELIELLIAQFPEEKSSSFEQIHCSGCYITTYSWYTKTEYIFDNNKWRKNK